MENFLLLLAVLFVVCIYTLLANWFLKKSISSTKKRYIISTIAGVILTAITCFLFALYLISKIGGC